MTPAPGAWSDLVFRSVHLVVTDWLSGREQIYVSPLLGNNGLCQGLWAQHNSLPSKQSLVGLLLSMSVRLAGVNTSQTPTGSKEPCWF